MKPNKKLEDIIKNIKLPIYISKVNANGTYSSLSDQISTASLVGKSLLPRQPPLL